MKSDAEKNLLFVGIVMLLMVVIIGINLVDGSLTRLMLPDLPFSTVSVKYNHGMVLTGPESELCLVSPSLAALWVAGDVVHVETVWFKIRTPYILTLGNIENMRTLTGLLTKLIPSGIFFIYELALSSLEC